MMRIKSSDLNVTMQPMRKAQLIAEVNNALEVLERIDQQIDFWLGQAPSINTKIMQDELHFLKKGKV